jgi:lipoprotein-anchoring transpeptidase ErfK/SrfK
VALAALLAACAAALLVPGTAARSDSGAVTWQAPTPVAGSVVTASAGKKVSVQLVAVSTLPTAAIRIAPAAKLPRGARLSSTAGNPAHAVLSWVPQGWQVGTHALQFKAVETTAVAITSQPVSFQARVEPGAFKLSGDQNISRWAFVRSETVVRAAPRTTAYAKARLKAWTPEYYPNPVLALQERIDRNGTWVQVRLPILPNNSTGWVKRAAVGGFRITRDHLVVDRAATRATLFRNGAAIFTTRVGVGKSYWPTPRGEFYITEKMSGFHDAAYGPIAFGTSARSAVLTDWPGGGYIGIHGTDAPGLIPGHISHGCVRVRNATIVRLARLMGVGTPLTIR